MRRTGDSVRLIHFFCFSVGVALSQNGAGASGHLHGATATAAFTAAAATAATAATTATTEAAVQAAEALHLLHLGDLEQLFQVGCTADAAERARSKTANSCHLSSSVK
jgi:hypothetical protein